MRASRFLFLCFFIFLLLGGCATEPLKPGEYRVFGKIYRPMTKADGYSESGLASWYGADFHGKKTSSGEDYDMYGRTCAHKTLPLGTRVRIRNLENNRTCEARVNDRGPFVEGRIVDLSFTVAKELGIVDKGTAMVRVEPLDGVTLEDGLFTWQIGSFVERKNADRLAASARERVKDVRVVEAYVGGRTVFRVQVGKYTTRTLAAGDRATAVAFCDKPWLVGYD